jgi:hypothetical protein
MACADSYLPEKSSGSLMISFCDEMANNTQILYEDDSIAFIYSYPATNGDGLPAPQSRLANVTRHGPAYSPRYFRASPIPGGNRWCWSNPAEVRHTIPSHARAWRLAHAISVQLEMTVMNLNIMTSLSLQCPGDKPRLSSLEFLAITSHLGASESCDESQT